MSATVTITVSPRSTVGIIFHHTSLSSSQTKWPALRGSATGSSRTQSHDHVGHRTPQRVWHLRSAAETYHQVGALRAQPEPLSELRAHSPDFDRLIDESGSHAECRRSKREVLVSAADFKPVCRVGALPDEN